MATAEERARTYHESSARGGYQPTLPQQPKAPPPPAAGEGLRGQSIDALAQRGINFGSPANQQSLAFFGITPESVQGRQAEMNTPEMRAQNREAPPQNPAEALRYQFYGAQDAEAQNREMLQQAMNAYGEARQESSAAHQESQARNEQLMREGLQQRMQEQEMVRQQNFQMMQQRQATLQHMFGLLRQGGEGSLASFMSPLGSEMGQTYQMGMYTPQDYGSYYGGMRGTPDPSSQYTAQMGNVMANTQYGAPDYSAWMDPESMRSQWYLPPQTQVQQSTPNAPGAPGPQSTFQAPTPQGGAPQPQQMLYDWQRNPQQWADEINRYFQSQNY